MPFIIPEDVVELGGFPMRLIVAAGSGGGKTTYVRRLLEALLPHTGRSIRVGISGAPGVARRIADAKRQARGAVPAAPAGRNFESAEGHARVLKCRHG
jgi:hypothetical protein